jgi:hypothetical protein
VARSSWEVAGRGMPSTEDRVDAFGKSLGRGGRQAVWTSVDDPRRRVGERAREEERVRVPCAACPLLRCSQQRRTPTRTPPESAFRPLAPSRLPAAGRGLQVKVTVGLAADQGRSRNFEGVPKLRVGTPVAHLLRSVRHNARRDAPQLARSVPWAAPRGAGTRPPWPAREASSGSCAERLSRRRTTSPTPGSSIRRPWRRSARDSSRRTWKGPRAIPPSKRPRERRRAMPRKAGRARPRVSARPSGWPTPSNASRGTSSGGPPSSSSSRTRRWTSRRTKRRARAATPTRAPR